MHNRRFRNAPIHRERAAFARSARFTRSLFDSLEQRVFLSAGATVPYTSFEAENGSFTGTLLTPSYTANTVRSESSGRSAVQLTTAGQYVQITATADANSVVVRYSIPDAAAGGGIDSTINLLINGAVVKTLALTSKYSYLYGAYPYTNTPSSGSPRNFYDEVRASGLSIHAGDTVQLMRSAGDNGASCTVDLIDLENVAPALTQPAGNWISAQSFGTVGNGVADDTTAIRNAVNAAISQGKSLFIPAGTYKMTSFITGLNNVTMQGAGMWYTTFVGDASLYGTASRRVGFMGGGSNIHLSDFAITGNLTYRGDSEANDGIGGSFGTGSSISKLWIEHTKVGMWLVNSNGLTVSDCRYRDTIADGMNFVVGMRNGVATNCTARGTGDDCFAIWPATYIGQTYAPGLNTYSHCTGIAPFLANGGAIYGGEGNTIDQCLFQDIPGAGVLISGTFDVGSNTFTGTTTVSNSDLIRDGAAKTLAAMQFAMNNHPIAGVVLSGLNITSSPYSAIGVSNAQPLTATANNLNIGTVGLVSASPSYGVYAQSNTVGSLSISNSTIGDYDNASPNFTLAFNSTTGTLPAPWLAGDLGDAGLKGSATLAGGTYTVKGSGNDIGAAADTFQFASQSVIGDYTLVTRVDSITAASAAAKAGLMFRASTATGAMFANITVTAGDTLAFQYRTASGAVATSGAPAFITAFPEWLKLVRSGNNFSACASPDGATWTQVGATQSIAMSPTTLAGLAVTAHDNAKLATATFSNVAVAPTFASQSGAALNVKFSSADPITLSTGGGNVIATQAGVTLSFLSAGVSSIVVSFDAMNANVLNINGALAQPITFAAASGSGAGGADTINVNAGTFTAIGDLASAATSLTLNIAGGASALFGSSQHLAALNIAGNGSATLLANGNRVLAMQSLSIGASGVLDLNDNDLVATNTPKSTIETYIKTAYHFGDWLGAGGIFSTTARDNPTGNTMLGLLGGDEFANNNGAPTFDGQPVHPSDVFIKYTYFGDVDFNGAIDSTDYNLIDFGFLTGASGWANGDADFSNAIDSTDYNLIDFAFVSQNGIL